MTTLTIPRGAPPAFAPLATPKGDNATSAYTSPTMTALRRPLSEDQLSSLRILVAVRWLMLAAAAGVTWVAAGTTATELGVLTLILAGSAALNAFMHQRLRRGDAIPLWLPLFLSAFDVSGLTAVIATVDGFDNPNYLLYFPAFLGFTLVFPGWRSLVYCLVIMGAYTAVVVTTHDAFSWSDKADVKDLFLRLVTLGGALMVANMVVRLDRIQRDRAVRAERAAALERERVSEEIHDGVSQNIYMLTMSLEDAAARTAEGSQAERLQPLVQMAKQTLIETRGLLTNLQPVLAGSRGLRSLLEAQCQEFSAVTGLSAEFESSGTPRQLPPEAIAEIYRVTQEGLANVYRHADAGSATLTLRYEPEAVVVEVRDDGGGIAPGTSGSGRGLDNMHQRARRLGGELTIGPNGGGGTCVRLTLPLEQS